MSDGIAPAYVVTEGDYEALTALLMAHAPGMPYGNAEAIALAVVMNDAIPQRWATVTADVLHVRTYPATERNGEAVAIAYKLTKGARVQIWKMRDDGWYCVTSRQDNRTIGGWVAAEFLTEV